MGVWVSMVLHGMVWYCMALYVELLNSINAAPHIGSALSKWTHSMLLIKILIDFQHCNYNRLIFILCFTIILQCIYQCFNSVFCWTNSQN